MTNSGHANAATATPRFFYGWVVVIALGMIGSLAICMAGVNFGFFIRPMSEELGIQEAFFGWAMSARQVGSAASGLILGRLVDRYGARIPLIAAAFCAGILMTRLAGVRAGWDLVALFFLLGLTGLQGAGGDLYAGVSIAKWFYRDRGRAMAFTFLGAPLGIFAFTPLTQLLISHYGWQTAFQILGVTCGSLIMLLAIAVRRQPQDMGLLPDGAARPGRDVASHQGEYVDPLELSWTRVQALRSETFWRLAIVFGAMMFSIATVGIFRVPHFVGQGIDAQLVAFAFSAEAVASAVVAVPVGVALDRFESRYVAAGAFAMLAAAVAATMFAQTTWQMFLAMTLFGLGVAGIMVLQNTIWPIYFGAAHIGSIRGVARAVTLVFGMAGAPIAGAVKDATGSYLPIWWVALGGLLLAAVLMLATRKPEMKPR